MTSPPSCGGSPRGLRLPPPREYPVECLEGCSGGLPGDDQKILWVKPERPPTASELQVVMNWFPELKRLAPTR